MSGSMQYLAFRDWLVSFNMIVSSSNHFPANFDIISFLFMAE
jgi:hypothetical protein